MTKIRIKIYLENIAEDPRSKGKMLKANRKGQWRYRIGDYRIIADISDETITILVLFGLRCIQRCIHNFYSSYFTL